MADIKHTHHAASVPTGPTEGDGISYKGIVWFVVILAVTTLACSVLMWWAHQFEKRRLNAEDTPLAPYSQPGQQPPPPNLISLDSWHQDDKGQPKMPAGEPSNLQRFRDSEDAVLNGYGWIDRNGEVVRIPIDRAKALLLQRGLPARSTK